MWTNDQNHTEIELLVSELVNNKAYVKFNPRMLGDDITLNQLMSYFEFLSPIMILMHGSTVSKKRFSDKNNSDLDIVCVSPKAAFWPLEQLYNRLDSNLKHERTRIDVSIISVSEFITILDRNSSLSTSFTHGFAILHPRVD